MSIMTTRLQRPPHAPAHQDNGHEDENPRNALDVAEGQADQSRGERAEALQSEQVPEQANQQRRHGQQQQELDQVRLGGRQRMQRDAAEDPLQGRRGFGIVHFLPWRLWLDQEGIVQVLEVLAPRQRQFAMAEHQERGRDAAAVVVEGA
jgi:hypothetical protein